MALLKYLQQEGPVRECGALSRRRQSRCISISVPKLGTPLSPSRSCASSELMETWVKNELLYSFANSFFKAMWSTQTYT